MEGIFDTLRAAFQKDPASLKRPELRAALAQLLQYYQGGQWLADYELDEKGLLPAELKRGVLSQDGLFNYFSDINPD